MPIIYLAPIQGTTDRIYRSLFPAYFKGVDLAVMPFIASLKKIKASHSLLIGLHPEHNTGIFSVPQIMSSRAEEFVLLANQLYDMGHKTVNLNLGCPFPMVVRKGRGAGMLCHPDRIEAFLQEALPGMRPAVSVKLRLGLKSSQEILKVIEVFNRFALAGLIIHPRTAAQMYEGEVDLDMFRQCLELSVHPVVYNGDIDSTAKYEMLAARFPTVAGWMIGRGLIGNPFLAEEIKGAPMRPDNEKTAVMRAFHDELLARYSQLLSGEAHLINKMKEIWTYMSNFFKNSEKARKHIYKTHSLPRYLDAVRKIFDEALSDKLS